MAAKDAIPDRYTVDRVGVPDPEGSEYFVLNVTQDPLAREALAYLGNQYRRQNRLQLSQECFDLLDRTMPAFAAVMDKRNALFSKQQKGKKTTKVEQGR